MSRPKIKKVNTNKRKHARKETQQKLAERTGFMLGLPEECTMCKASFDKKNREMVTTWNVTIYEGKRKIYLTCPSCWRQVEQLAKENVENEN